MKCFSMIKKRERDARYRAKNKHKIKRYQDSRKETMEAYYHKHNLKTKYGISPEQYQEMFVAQKGCCAMCGKHQSQQTRRLAVDHNHETGQIRALLCLMCNIRLSYIEDREWLLKATEYLKKYE